ncbi:MAG TPA: hypothetical protein VMH05_22180 [Bryobacteraceae bacterium]|nr:hypothetical protein [Bryobacteraceae bacterium]
MKIVNRIALLLAAAIGTTGLYAQSMVVANVPFDFMVKGQTMPAGKYHVTRDFARPDILEISNLDASRSVQVVTYKATVTEPGAASPRMVFTQYGNRYFFSELWTSDGVESRTNASKLERELKASATPKKAPRITVAAVDN